MGLRALRCSKSWTGNSLLLESTIKRAAELEIKRPKLTATRSGTSSLLELHAVVCGAILFEFTNLNPSELT